MNIGQASNRVDLPKSASVSTINELLCELIALSGQGRGDAKVIADSCGGTEPEEATKEPPCENHVIAQLRDIRRNMHLANDDLKRAKNHLGL